MSILDSLTAAFSGTDSIAAMRPQDQDVLRANATAGALQSFGGFMGAMSHVMYGLQANRAAEFEAAQMREAGGQAVAASQRSAFEVQRQTDLVTSRALAVAAASGGGASDPTVVSIIARDAAQGAYQKAVALYQGQDRARYLDLEAAGREYSGRAELRNSLMVGGAQAAGGVASILRSQARGASLYDRFAGNGPPGVGQPGWGADLTGDGGS